MGKSFLYPLLLASLIFTGALTCSSDNSAEVADPATGVVTVQAQVSSSAAAPAAEQKLGTETTVALTTVCTLTLTDSEGNAIATNQFSQSLQYNSGGVPIHGQAISDIPSIDLSTLDVPAGCFNLNLSCVQQGLTFPFDFFQSWSGDAQFCSGSNVTVLIVTSNIFDLTNNEAIQELVLTVGCPVIAFILTLEPVICGSGDTNFCGDCPEGQCLQISEDLSICINDECPPLGDGPGVSCEDGGDAACRALEEEFDLSSSCVEVEVDADTTIQCCEAGLSFTTFLCTIVIPGLTESAESLCSSTEPVSCQKGVQPCGTGFPSCPTGMGCDIAAGSETGCCVPAVGGCTAGPPCSERGCPVGFTCNEVNRCCEPSCAIGPCDPVRGCGGGTVCNPTNNCCESSGSQCVPDSQCQTDGDCDSLTGPGSTCLNNLENDFCRCGPNLSVCSIENSQCTTHDFCNTSFICLPGDPDPTACSCEAVILCGDGICHSREGESFETCPADCPPPLVTCDPPCGIGETCVCDLPPTTCSCVTGGPPPK